MRTQQYKNKKDNVRKIVEKKTTNESRFHE